VEARLFPLAAEIVGDRLLVRFAGNEKGVAYQVEEALKLVKNAEVVMDDAALWKTIVVAQASEKTIGETAKSLMQRIKTQLDPNNILAADKRGLWTD
jgi:nitrate reductase NapAB chaperone NapD